MDVPVHNIQNDVPDYLNDLIPYRCPKCGHQRRFATLRELRIHLQNDHSFQMGFIKPHSRATVFSKDSNHSNNSSKEVLSSTRNDNGKHNFHDFRESSPLLRSFKDEANVLEIEVQKAKQNEMRNKAISMKNLSNISGNSELRQEGVDNMAHGQGRQLSHNTNICIPMATQAGIDNIVLKQDGQYKQNTNSAIPMARIPSRIQPNTKEEHSDVRSTLDKLNAEVMKSRLNQWVTSDALYKSQDILNSMEEAADTSVREQQSMVQQLVQDIRSKGEKIEEREREQRVLQNERQRIFEETENMMKDADAYNHGLQQELNQRNVALENIAMDMKRLQKVSEKELKSRENDLQSAREKMRRLEWERDRLIDETETILKRADYDNSDLRNTIKVKEEELQTVNIELNKLRQSQQTLLQKTADIENRAEEGRRLMKSVLDAKNSQLESAIKQLEEMKALQGQLMEESKILTEQADDNTQSMQRLLQKKEEHVKGLAMELQRLQEEKIRLEENTSSLAEKTERSSSVIENLKDIVKNKEKDLKATQSELAELKDFLQTAAAKERGARKKLEKFIDELIMRAEKAEAELRTLRSQSTNTSESNPAANDGMKRSSLNLVKNELKDNTSLKSFTENSVANEGDEEVSECSERLGLPTRLSPPKPPRTKLKSPQPRNVAARNSQAPDNAKTLGYNPTPQGNLIHTRAEIHRQSNIPTPVTHQLQQNQSGVNVVDPRLTDYSVHPKGHLHETKTEVHRPYPYSDMLTPVTHQLQPNPTYVNEVGPSLRGHNVRPEGFVAGRRNVRYHTTDIPVENDNDSTTLNTDSLITYLNEGLLNQVDKQHRSNLRNSSMPSHHQQNRTWLQGDNEQRIHQPYRNDRQTYLQFSEPERNVRQGYYNNTNIIPSRHEHHQDSEYTESSRRKPTYHYESRAHSPPHGYSSNTTANHRYPRYDRTGTANHPVLHNNRHNYSTEPVVERHYRQRSDPTHDYKYTRDTSYQNSNLQSKYVHTKPKSNFMKQYFEQRERLKALDKSLNSKQRYSGVGRSRRSDSPERYPRTVMKKKKVFKKKGELKEFDSTYPDIYKSMHDLNSGPRQKSKERYRTSSRRSRSLSPDVVKHRSEKILRRRQIPEHSDTVSHKDARRLEDHTDEEDSQKYALLDESSDDSRQGFVELMDENGILWASNDGKVADTDGPSDLDNDADTLPDISDSELDRVSPSGSEAIATKKTNQTTTVITSRKRGGTPQYSSHSSSQKVNSNIQSQNDHSKSSSKSVSIKSKGNISERHGKTPAQQNNNARDKLKTSRIVRVSVTDEDRLVNQNAVFQPINLASSSRHSMSDKDLTSGGKEVHEFVKRSPLKQMKGSPETVSGMYTSLSGKDSRHSCSMKSGKNSTETLEEKLSRISDKYKSQRVVIGSSKNNPRNDVPASKNSIDSKVQSINEKYKAKRQAIVESKGVTGLKAETDVFNQRPTFSRGSESTIKDMLRSTHDINQRQYHSNKAGAAHVQASSPYINSQKSNYSDTEISKKPHGSPMAYQIDNMANYGNLPYTVPGQNIPHNATPIAGLSVNHPGLPFPSTQDGSLPHNMHIPAGQIYNPYLYHNAQLQGISGQGSAAFPYLFPYFHPNMHLGLQTTGQQVPTDSVNQKENGKIENEQLQKASTSLTQSVRNQDESRSTPYIIDDKTQLTHKSDEVTVHRGDMTLKSESITSDAKSTKLARDTEKASDTKSNVQQVDHTIENRKTYSPMVMMESDIESERMSMTRNIGMKDQQNQRHNQEQKQIRSVGNTAEPEIQVESSYEELVVASSLNSARVHSSNDTSANVPSHFNPVEEAPTQELDVSSASEGISMFAAPIEDDLTGTCNSNTQSMIDMQGCGVETDLDTDTESVKRDFFEKARKIRGMLSEMHDDDIDSVSQRSYRNAMSSASSQASIDFLDNIPYSRREETKRRRQALSSIFKFLDTGSLCKVAEVCREWKIVSRSPKLWKRIELRNEKVSQKFLFFLARRSTQLKVLVLEDIRPRNRKSDESIEEYQSTLRSSLDGAVEQILKRSEASLHTISIVNCGTLLSSKCLWAASCYSRMLKHVTYITDFDPVSSEVMWALGSGCRDLQTLFVHPVNPCQNSEKFNTRCAQLIGKCFPVLEKLSLGGRLIDIAALVYIAKQCQKIEHIELHHMSLLTKDLVEQICEHGFRNVKVLKLMSTPIEPEGIPVIKEHCKLLEMLYIRLSVNDYFKGTDQTEDLKVFEGVTQKYEELKKGPKLRRILKLKINKI